MSISRQDTVDDYDDLGIAYDNNIGLDKALEYEYNDVAKEIVDKIYESMMLKIGHKLMIHEAYAKKDGYTSKWHVSQVKWYKKMLGHLLFIRKNKGYYKEVAAILKERHPHGT